MSVPRLVFSLLASCLVLGACLALAAVGLSPHGGVSGAAAPRLRLSSSAEQIAIGNSLAGRAVLSAKGMVPGQTTSGEVTVSNPTQQPIAVDLSAATPAAGPLARALVLAIAESDGAPVYRGALADLPKLALGTLGPGESRGYSFSSTLPAQTGDALQGQATSVDLRWVATAAAKARPCGPQFRSRLLVFRGRDAVRLVSRYRSDVDAEVAVAFYERLGGKRLGRRFARATTTVASTRDDWRIERVTVPLDAASVERWRRSGRGFAARVEVRAAAIGCHRRLRVDLSEHRVFGGQGVWFEKGSFGSD